MLLAHNYDKMEDTEIKGMIEFLCKLPYNFGRKFKQISWKLVKIKIFPPKNGHELQSFPAQQ